MDRWHCPNGHLVFETLNGRGCLRPGCPHRVVSRTVVPKRRKHKPKPKDSKRPSLTGVKHDLQCKPH